MLGSGMAVFSQKSKSRPGYEPLFGKSQASYKVTSSSLKGATFYLVSGHVVPTPDVSDAIREKSCTKTSMPTTLYYVWAASC